MTKDKSLVDKLTDVDASKGLYEALRAVLGCDHGKFDETGDDAGDLLVRLADAIEYEYFPRPRWKGGEPVHVGDYYMKDSGLREVTNIFARVKLDNDFIFNGETFILHTRIEPDTQERIDSDSWLSPREYLSDVLESSIENLAECDMRYMMIRDLLRRQRELDRRDK